MFQRLCEDPQALVEVYLNYDCDSEALANVYERLMNIISKISAAHSTVGAKGSDPHPSSSASSKRTSSILTSSSAVPPSLTTVALGQDGKGDGAHGASNLNPAAADARLKRQGLDCLVAVLKSLVVWGTASGSSGKIGGGASSATSTLDPSSETTHTLSRSSEDGATLLGSGNRSMERLSPGPQDHTRGMSVSSLAVDDPGLFESAKLKKTTLLEGIKKFNFKPKRVS